MTSATQSGIEVPTRAVFLRWLFTHGDANMTRTFTATYDRRESVQDDSPEVNSNALILAATDIERLVAERIGITPGSCEISRTSSRGRANTTLFRVLDENGKTVVGRIEVRLAADGTSIRIIPEVRVLGWVQWRAPRTRST